MKAIDRQNHNTIIEDRLRDTAYNLFNQRYIYFMANKVVDYETR